MKTVPIVREEDAKLARSIEDKMTAVSKEAGILFVGVEVYPQDDGPEFHLTVGCSRNLDGRTIQSLTVLTIGNMVDRKKLLLQVHRGVLGAAAK